MRTRLLFAGIVGVLVALALVAGAASAHDSGNDTDHDDMDRMMDRCMEMAEGMINGGGPMMDGAGEKGMMDDRDGTMNEFGTDDRHDREPGTGCH